MREKTAEGYTIENAALRAVHHAKYDDGERRACYVTVGSVRELKPLDVVPEPDEDDPAHALIVGIPDLTLGINELGKAEYFAGELAKRAKPYTFPADG
jgi:hypothetical protein